MDPAGTIVVVWYAHRSLTDAVYTPHPRVPLPDAQAASSVIQKSNGLTINIKKSGNGQESVRNGQKVSAYGAVYV